MEFPILLSICRYLLFLNQLHIHIEKVQGNIPVLVLEKPDSLFEFCKVDFKRTSFTATCPSSVLCLGKAVYTKESVGITIVFLFIMINSNDAVCSIGFSKIAGVPLFFQCSNCFFLELFQTDAEILFAFLDTDRIAVFVKAVEPFPPNLANFFFLPSVKSH